MKSPNPGATSLWAREDCVGQTAAQQQASHLWEDRAALSNNRIATGLLELQRNYLSSHNWKDSR